MCLFVCFPGLEIEGIFRRSANVTLVKEIQHRYNSGQISHRGKAFLSERTGLPVALALDLA